MLDFRVPEQFAEQVKALVCPDAKEFPHDLHQHSRTKILADIVQEFKGEEIAPRMSAYSVKYNEDGTAVVKPFDSDYGNEHTLLNFLEDDGQAIMLSKQGKRVCIAPFRVNGVAYIRTFDPAEAPHIRDALSATLTPPKEPSFYDTVCNFFATRFLKRPGKAVQAYNDKKAYYDGMRKGLATLTGIADQVEKYKLELAEEEKRLEQERQQKQKELEDKLEQDRIQKEKEEALRRQREEQKKQDFLNLKNQMEAENKKFDQQLKQQKREAARNQPQSEEVIQFQIEELTKAYEVLPGQARTKKRLQGYKDNLTKAVQKGEQDLATVKGVYEKDLEKLEKAKKHLDDTYKVMKAAKEDLRKLDQMKVLAERKTAATEKLKLAQGEVARYKQEREQQRNMAKQLKKEYDAMKGDEFLYDMTPEQYIHSLYVKSSEEREKSYRAKRDLTLGKELKDLENDIAKAKRERDDLKAKSGRLDRAPLIGGLRTTGKALQDAEDKLANMEKRYAALQAQDKKNWEEFQNQEKEYAKIQDDYSPDRIELARATLKENREKGEAKYKAYRDAENRANDLTELIKKENDKITEAQDELDAVQKDSLSALKYDATEHQELKEQVLHIESDIEHGLLPSLKILKSNVDGRGQLVSSAEIELGNTKKQLENTTKAYDDAETALAKTTNKIESHAMSLSRNGIAVPQPPEEALPYLQNMFLFQKAIQAQQDQPQIPQHQHQPGLK